MLTTVTHVSAEGGGPGVAEPRSIDRIRGAALASFAAQGAAATTLRGVAAAAGVSLGLVQHHFATKAGLIKAVDEYVLDVVITPMAQPIEEQTSDSISEVGRRVNRIIAEHPDVAAYLGRALVDGSALGHVVFDRLFEVGVARWQARADCGEARPDIDVVWAATNALVLALGAVSLRPHIERHLPEPFTAPSQLDRWQTSVDTLLRDGLFPPTERS
ncbi:TetR family transcriptional regulator [Arthrobacter sp. SLBN-53]|nr:TetR family transcriptional regulator [Arthrobacter sp. SLBN-53]